MNFTIWIRNPYPFRYDEIEAIQDALQATYTRNAVYLREWPVDYVSVDGTNITTCKQIALTLRTIHKQWAIQDKKNTGRVYCQDLEIDIREAIGGASRLGKEEGGLTMINMSTCVRCHSTIIGDTKVHLERCYQAQRVKEALQYCEDDAGLDSLTLEQVSEFADYLINTDLSGDLIARLAIGELKDF